MTTIRPIGGLLASVHSDEIAHAFSAFERDLTPARPVPLQDILSINFPLGDRTNALDTTWKSAVMGVDFPIDLTGWTVDEPDGNVGSVQLDVQIKLGSGAWASVTGAGVRPGLAAQSSNTNAAAADPDLAGWTPRVPAGCEIQVVIVSAAGVNGLAVWLRANKLPVGLVGTRSVLDAGGASIISGSGSAVTIP